MSLAPPLASSARSPRALRALVAASTLLLFSLSCARRRPPPDSTGQLAAPASPDPSSPRLAVRRLVAPLALDGRLEEPAWQSASRTGPLREPDTDAIARPYSEARFLHDDDNLYVALYAADEDVRATASHDGPLWAADAFSLRLQPSSGPCFDLDLAPNGAVTDFREDHGRRDLSWESGALVSVDVDETLNDDRDIDEEWVIEAAIPWSSLGLAGPPASLGVSVRRCDILRDRSRRCGQWGAARGEPAGRLEFAPRGQRP